MARIEAPVSKHGAKARVLRALLALCLWGCVVGADVAGAALGDLTQKPGAAACTWNLAAGLCAGGRGLATPVAVAVSSDGASAYVASVSSDAVAVFDRAADGTLTQKPGTAGCISDTGDAGACLDGKALDIVSGVAVSPNGRSVYTVAQVGGVAVFDRASDGTLTQKAGTAGCIASFGVGPCVDGRAIGAAVAVTVSADDASVYVAGSNGVAVFDRAADGTLTQKPGTDGCISGNPTGGECASGTALDGPASVTVSRDRRSVYVASVVSDAVAVFDRAASGVLTQKPGPAGCISQTGSGGACAGGVALDGAVDVTVSPDDKSVYVVSGVGDALAVFDRAEDGTLTQKPGAAGCISETGSGGACVDATALDGAASVTVGPDRQSVYVASRVSDAVAVFDRSADGVLTQKAGAAACVSDAAGGPCVDGTALDGAESVTASPDARSVYVTAQSSDAVAVFDRESTRPPPFVPPPPPPPPPPPGQLDRTRPLLSALSVSPTRLRVAARGPSIVARGGSRVSYRLSEPAAVRFTVQLARTGRRVGGRCVGRTRSNRRARRCTRYRSLPRAFTHAGTRGANTFRFSGRLPDRRLRPGGYRLRAVATDRAGNASTPRHRRFRIVLRGR